MIDSGNVNPTKDIMHTMHGKENQHAPIRRSSNSPFVSAALQTSSSDFDDSSEDNGANNTKNSLLQPRMPQEDGDDFDYW